MLAMGTATATAQEPVDPHLLTIGAGYFGVYQPNDVKAADIRVEFRPGVTLLDFNQPGFAVKPFVGLEVATDGSVFGLGGFLLDFVVAEHVVVTPSIGVGAYGAGNGRDLGHVIEFRSQVEVGYRFDNDARITAAIGHISNANIGARNPGVEIATVYVHLPLRLFGLSRR